MKEKKMRGCLLFLFYCSIITCVHTRYGKNKDKEHPSKAKSKAHLHTTPTETIPSTSLRSVTTSTVYFTTSSDTTSTKIRITTPHEASVSSTTSGGSDMPPVAAGMTSKNEKNKGGKHKDKSLKTWVMVCVIVGVLILATLFVLIICLICRHRRQYRSPPSEKPVYVDPELVHQTNDVEKEKGPGGAEDGEAEPEDHVYTEIPPKQGLSTTVGTGGRGGTPTMPPNFHYSEIPLLPVDRGAVSMPPKPPSSVSMPPQPPYSDIRGVAPSAPRLETGDASSVDPHYSDIPTKMLASAPPAYVEKDPHPYITIIDGDGDENGASPQYDNAKNKTTNTVENLSSLYPQVDKSKKTDKTEEDGSSLYSKVDKSKKTDKTEGSMSSLYSAVDKKIVMVDNDLYGT